MIGKEGSSPLRYAGCNVQTGIGDWKGSSPLRYAGCNVQTGIGDWKGRKQNNA